MDGAEPPAAAFAAPPPLPVAPDPVGRRRGWQSGLLAVLLALVGLVAIGLVVLESPIGHRFVVDRIARYAPASGMRVEVGRIDGTLTGAATLRDVRFSDPQGLFLEVPEIELDWRPLRWFSAGLDVRKLILRRGLLHRAPRLNPGDPDAPILPDFDIRIDRFELDRLTLGRGVMGTPRRIDLVARTTIRQGRAYLLTDAQLGGSDRLHAYLDSEPKADRFVARLDYNAPRGGVLAALVGARDGMTLQVHGAGRYTAWQGRALAKQGDKALADLALVNRAGRYSFSGSLHPGAWVPAALSRVTGDTVQLRGAGTLVDSVLAGDLAAQGRGVDVTLRGTADLARNALRQVKLVARTRDPGLLGPGSRIEAARLEATLDGELRDLVVQHRLTATRIAWSGLSADRIVQQGRLTRIDNRWTLPVDLTTGRIVTGNALVDPRLATGRARGTIVLDGTRLSATDLVVGAPGLGASLQLNGDTRRGDYRLTGPIAARDVALANLGLANADLRLDARFGRQPWLVDAGVRGRMTQVRNATLTTLAGTGIRFAGGVRIGGAQPLLLQRFTIDGSKLAVQLNGRNRPGGVTTLAGTGRHRDYGRFTLEAAVEKDGPHAVLVLANPLPAAGLRDVRVALAPIAEGFRIETAGQSALGPFAGRLGLFSPPGGPTRVAVEQFSVWQTAMTGAMTLGADGVTGALDLAGGGLDGTLRLAPRDGGQGFNLALTAENARFGGTTPIGIALARISAAGTLVNGHSTLSGTVFAEGLQQGSLFIGRLAANAALKDGVGQINAALSGRRGGRFELQLVADVSPDQYRLLAQGDYAGQSLAMPRRAVLTRTTDGWELAPSQIDFAGGRLIASGRLGEETRLDLAMADMPLALIDIVAADLGLGGKASGTVAWRRNLGGAPTAEARLEVRGLTRSGLVLTSRPIDLSLVARLAETSLETRAVVREAGAVRGRLQGRIDRLPGEGSLAERLNAGTLFGQLRYSGPADALWRLAALETFDLNGPLDVAADVTGSLRDPVINGSLASSGLRLQSALTGTDVRNVTARGTFAGSRLQLATFTGATRNGGRLSGSGMVDLSGLGVGHGPALDLKLAARDAELIARDDMAATVTGPLRIVSNGVGGTIAGRVTIAAARWNLGRTSVAAELPQVRTREINPRADVAPTRAPAAPWRYLIDARGDGRIDVRGLGLDSEWGATIRLRGTTLAPAIFGEALLVRGGYDFAGKRFELTKGVIRFDGNSPPDPRLDIAATAEVTNLTATVAVQGTAAKPEIRFSSVPSLPEEELLSRLLFGSSITQLSTPEAVQIGAALASLRGGGGLDPINSLRTAIGLDRLRIMGADTATGRGTSVAVGKNLGRRFYAEIVTDGRGYNATQLEFRVTRWLSLLASVSSLGRQGVDAKVSKDY
ncbi:translocation/assembly module TamB domain-containing protein [Novosphingobium piscinae]|uniref:Translocation/assembly module TamB domain-containing protein n=1 Tax=Novosphingobium piscinae TaxID=1507448 RepID=A0A7X1FWI1_9SPHN|nr:translocation/assembly module TamB domain-containing protein [Novosphingobium piscinae]MBC2668298.1 translocation/assembly module TamB domain-containing protein [Novosphingobium piscinae]